MIPFRDDVIARRYPLTTVLIILVNVLVFLYELSLPPQALMQFVSSYGLVPEGFLELDSDTRSSSGTSILTSMFLHGGWFHLIGNMWYLWIFGDNVEDRMGHIRFLVFYLVCGFAGSVAHILSNPSSSVPSIGASGAVAGVLGAYLISYPFARILTLIPLFLLWPIIELPAVLVLGSWFLIQLLSGASTLSATSGVAWWAHIGGFLTGMILIGLFARRPSQRFYR
jgi:membrane associated rhomboid family serine protease